MSIVAVTAAHLATEVVNGPSVSEMVGTLLPYVVSLAGAAITGLLIRPLQRAEADIQKLRDENTNLREKIHSLELNYVEEDDFREFERGIKSELQVSLSATMQTQDLVNRVDKRLVRVEALQDAGKQQL